MDTILWLFLLENIIFEVDSYDSDSKYTNFLRTRVCVQENRIYRSDHFSNYCTQSRIKGGELSGL